MRREEWTAAINDLPPIGLKGIRNVVRFDAKKGANEQISAAIDPKFEPGIINGTATFDKTTAEYTVITGVKDLPVTHHVTAIVRFISHHDDESVAFGMVEAEDDGAAESMRFQILKWAQGFYPFLRFL